jgi:hypothetical protein
MRPAGERREGQIVYPRARTGGIGPLLAAVCVALAILGLLTLLALLFSSAVYADADEELPQPQIQEPRPELRQTSKGKGVPAHRMMRSAGLTG